MKLCDLQVRWRQNVNIEVGVDNVTLSWSTLDGVPILQYTVYIISQRQTETVNTTETHITLNRPYMQQHYLPDQCME